jgi:hypothetical protein
MGCHRRYTSGLQVGGIDAVLVVTVLVIHPEVGLFRVAVGVRRVERRLVEGGRAIEVGLDGLHKPLATTGQGGARARAAAAETVGAPD